MGFLDSLISIVEKAGEEPEAEEGVIKTAERVAEQEKAWMEDQVKSLMNEAMRLLSSANGDLGKTLEADQIIRGKLRKLVEESFQRGAKAASRMNVIST